MFSRLSNTRKLLIIFFIALMPIGLITTDYYFMSPGPPYQWEIDYGNNENYEFEGNLYQLTIRRDEANVFVYLWSLVNPSYDLYPKELILPDGVTPQELSEISIQNMRTSENVAIAVALKNIGYEIETKHNIFDKQIIN